jgi:DNA-binding transcriptional MerR regulator
MRIGELAERAGTSARTPWYYERHGLLRARRRANGYRDDDEADVRHDGGAPSWR